MSLFQRRVAQAHPEFAASITDLRESQSQVVLWILGGMSLCLAWYLNVLRDSPPDQTIRIWLVAPCALATCWASWWLLKRSLLAAHAVCLLGMAAVITIAIDTLQQPSIACFYALLPLLAVVLLGWGAGIAVEGGLALALYMAFVPIDPAFAVVIELAGLLAGLLGWAAMSTLATATEWSFASFVQARQSMEAAQNHRAQLAQMVVAPTTCQLWPVR